MDKEVLDRLYGCALGAVVGDALGMPLEFGPAQPMDKLVRQMLPGRLEAGSFTDDTEMALALAESLLTRRPLDPGDLGQRFLDWQSRRPADIGMQTSSALYHLKRSHWLQVSKDLLKNNPDSAGNGSLMRSWPVVIVYWQDKDALLRDSEIQGLLTHPHPECIAACLFANTWMARLVQGEGLREAYQAALEETIMPEALRRVILAAPQRLRSDLQNTGWVRHTLESVVWGLLNTNSFEEAVIQVANLGRDADTAAAVAGAVAGAAYGRSAIPQDWLGMLHGEWPIHSGELWFAQDFERLVGRLVETI